MIGKDPDTDLAVLSVSPKGPALHPLALGDSSTVRVGDPTVAIGNPFGLERTLTTGVVSALQRRITAPSGFAIEDVIQTDAAINPGNSGGPLLDATGRVIGVNSQIATGDGSSGSVGIGFAVPASTVRRVLPELETVGRVRRPFLGIRGRAAKGGVLVEDVPPGTPAARAGLRGGDREALDQRDGSVVLLGGDVLTRIDGRPVADMDDVHSMLTKRRPGQKVALELQRDGKQVTVSAELGERRAPRRPRRRRRGRSRGDDGFEAASAAQRVRRYAGNQHRVHGRRRLPSRCARRTPSRRRLRWRVPAPRSAASPGTRTPSSPSSSARGRSG